jgi:ribose 5-phosphate isomerase B
MKRKIYIAADHAGYLLKQEIINNFADYQIVDLGCDSADNAVDYPDYANLLASKLETDEAALGVVICGTGVGVSIAANRYKHIRAALSHNEEIAKLSREHNDANVLALGARFLSSEVAIKIVKKFLNSEFLGGRHKMRVEKL